VNKYRLGNRYIDKGSRRNSADQFLRWINVDGSGMLNSPGIRPLKYTSELHENNLPSFLVLVTHEVTSGRLNPWDDIVDLSNAEILYWGDAKANPNKDIDDFRGNATLRAIYNYLLTGERELVPPILHFSKPEKGYVQFNGLCVLEKLDITWFDDHGYPTPNYHAKLKILDCRDVATDWLHHRVSQSEIHNLDAHPDCPDAWRQYKKGNLKPINIWATQIKSKDDQLPEENSQDDSILKALNKIDAFAFEKIIVSLFRQLKDITHQISGTKKTGDGGFDFYGTFNLPRPLNYKISFLGEVKRYGRNTAIDPKTLSRLVARLNRKEYGIFVTTSYFTPQAQKEVLSDAYPVHLISGQDLLNIMKDLNVIKQGKLDTDWLDAVIHSE